VFRGSSFWVSPSGVTKCSFQVWSDCIHVLIGPSRFRIIEKPGDRSGGPAASMEAAETCKKGVTSMRARGPRVQSRAKTWFGGGQTKHAEKKGSHFLFTWGGVLRVFHG